MMSVRPRLPLFSLLLTSLVALLLSVSASTAAAAGMVSIGTPQANMRDGPGTRHEILYELARYYPLKVLARQGNWLKVRDFEGDVGWVHRKLTRTSPTLIVKQDRANVRSGPSTRYRIVTRLGYGEVMQQLGRQGRWVKVRLPQHSRTGWIARSLLWGG